MSSTSDIARNGSHSLPPPEYPAPPEYRRLSLKHNLLWTGIGTAVYYAAQYLLTPLITKLTDPESVGQYALGMAVTAPIIMFSQMQFRSVQVTDTKGEYAFTDYFWTRIYGTLLALLVIVIMAFGGDYSPAVRTIIVMCGLAKCFESLGDLTYGTLQSRDRMDYVAISQIIKSVISIVLFGGILSLTHQILPAILLLGGVWALVFFGFDLPFARKVGAVKTLWAFPSLSTMKQLVVLSLPLALTAAMNAYLVNLPRYALKPFGEKQVGYFSAIASLLGVVSLFTNTAIQATLNRISRLYQEEKHRACLRLAAQPTILYLTVSLIMTIVVWLGGKTLIRILYTQEYTPFSSVLLLMCIGLTINGFGVFGSMILYAGRKFRLQMLYTATWLVLCVPLYHVLVARNGILGAGQAEFAKYILGGVLMNLFAFPTLRELWRKSRTVPAANAEG